MEEEEDLVILDYGLPIATPSSGKRTKPVPTANRLFKNIENEIEAKKEIKQKENQSAIHEKIRKALEKKLGNPKLMRCMSAKEQTRIKELLQTCKQRRHIRQKNQFERPHTARSSGASPRNRYQSAKTSDRKLSIQNSRPKTAGPSRAISVLLQKSEEKGSPIASPIYSIINSTNAPNNSKLKKQNHYRNYSKLPQPEKVTNFYETNTSRCIQKQNYFQLENEQGNKYSLITPTPELLLQDRHGRKMKNKNMLKIKNKFHSILENCDNVRQDIVCLGRKIGHFEYFCEKINSKKSDLERYCRKPEDLNKVTDESF